MGRLAGDRPTVILELGQLWPLLTIAARIRSRASRSAVSGRPTRIVAGSPLAMSAFYFDQVTADSDQGHRVSPGERHQPTPRTCSITNPPLLSLSRSRPITSMRIRSKRIAVGVQPQHRQPAQPTALDVAHCVERRSVARTRPGFYLADDERVPLRRHDVDLAVGASPVAIQDPKAEAFQILDRGLLALSAEDVFRSHCHHL